MYYSNLFSAGHKFIFCYKYIPQSEGIGAAATEKVTDVSELGNKNRSLSMRESPSKEGSGRSSMVIF